MAAHYDNYDYPSYWIGREYENKAEAIAIKKLLLNINNIQNILEVGAGYGRLLPLYSYRAKKITISDPSARLLSLAKKRIKLKKLEKRVKVVQSTLQNLDKKVRKHTFDLVILVRVLHHMDDLDATFEKINTLLTDRGCLLLEFPNKRHFKAVFKEISKGNLTFPLDIFSIDIRSKKNIKKKTLPFVNYHPDLIVNKLEKAGFEVIDAKSVSNLRSPFLKRIVPIYTLLNLEEKLQDLLSKIYFGPSIFLLVRKRG